MVVTFLAATFLLPTHAEDKILFRRWVISRRSRWISLSTESNPGAHPDIPGSYTSEETPHPENILIGAEGKTL